MNEKNEELTIIDIQLLLSVVLTGVVIVSAIMGYNSHLKLKGEKPFWNEKQVRDILIVSKFIILITALITFGTSLINIDLTKKKNEDLSNAYLESLAAFIVTIPAILLLIVAFRKKQDDFLEGEII